MTRFFFDALVKLFAISVNRIPDSDTSLIKKCFREFLFDNLEPKYVESFLLFFDKYLIEYSSRESEKRLSLNSVKLIGLCNDTAKYLNHKDRAIIVFVLVRLINETSEIEDSKEFILLIAEIYELDIVATKELLKFIQNYDSVSNIKLKVKNNCFAKAIYFTQDIYVLINISSENFLIDTIVVGKSKFCYAIKESVITFSDQVKVYFNDYISYFNFGYQYDFKLFLKDVAVYKNSKTILNKISISLSSGEFVGIIGNSGCGKTSFLNAVSGKDKKTKGEFYLDAELKNLNYSFLNQDYQFIPGFSVKEHLRQRADFLQIKPSLKNELITQVAESVGLGKHIDKIVVKKDNTSYQLSGGQQKRLRIAMELLSMPDVFLLDEPTSGLSSEDSYQILSLLSRIAQHNKLVIASIHQPDYDSLILFDKILLIDDSGYPVYYGSPLKITEYLRNKTNTVDKNTVLEISKNPSVILNLLGVSKSFEKSVKDKSKFWYQNFISSDMSLKKTEHLKKKILPGNKRKLNSFKSFISSFNFDVKTEFKNKLRLVLLFIIPFITGLSFAFISKYYTNESYEYYLNSNIPVWILITVITAIFIGMVSSGNDFINFRNYHIADYYLKNKYFSFCFAKFVKYIIISFIQAVVIVLPAVFILKMEFVLPELILINWILCFWGAVAGMLASVLFKSSSVVYLVIPFIIVLNMLFSGVLIKFDTFNNKVFGNNPVLVTKVANLLPAFPTINTLTTEFYLYNDRMNNVFEEKSMYYEAVYYTDYFIPEIVDIYYKDSVVARNMLICESHRNNLFPQIIDVNCLSLIDSINCYYKNQKSNLFIKINENEILYEKDKNYCNKSIDAIVENYYTNLIDFDEKSLNRYYMTAYIPPYWEYNNISFNPFVSVFNKFVDLYIFTVLKIFLFSIIMFIIILFLKFRYR